jgi:hypothetical protein
MPDNGQRRILAYFGHHKCASTWIAEILRQVALEAGLHHFVVVDDLTPQASGLLRNGARNLAFERSALRTVAESRRADIVSCLTADRAQADILRPFRGVHVIRDPRDIVVSAYFSHRNSHPTDNVPHMAEHREALREVSQEEGLLLEMEFSSHELLELGEWDYGNEHILEVKMEDLTARPYETFISVFRHFELLAEQDPTLGRDQFRVAVARLANRRLVRHRWIRRLRRPVVVTGEMLLGTVYANRFETKTRGRAKGSEDVTSHYRKGIAGDWASHFTPRHAEAFTRKFGDLLINLGYEEDHSWVAETASRADLADSRAS